MNSKKNWYRYLCWFVDIIALIYLISLNISWYIACMVVLIPGFVNYLDGLWRGKNQL